MPHKLPEYASASCPSKCQCRVAVIRKSSESRNLQEWKFESSSPEVSNSLSLSCVLANLKQLESCPNISMPYPCLSWHIYLPCLSWYVYNNMLILCQKCLASVVPVPCSVFVSVLFSGYFSAFRNEGQNFKFFFCILQLPFLSSPLRHVLGFLGCFGNVYK